MHDKRGLRCKLSFGDSNRMAKDVDAALREIMQFHDDMNAEDTAAFVATRTQEKWYVRNVY